MMELLLRETTVQGGACRRNSQDVLWTSRPGNAKDLAASQRSTSALSLSQTSPKDSNQTGPARHAVVTQDLSQLRLDFILDGTVFLPAQCPEHELHDGCRAPHNPVLFDIRARDRLARAGRYWSKQGRISGSKGSLLALS